MLVAVIEISKYLSSKEDAHLPCILWVCISILYSCDIGFIFYGNVM